MGKKGTIIDIEALAESLAHYRSEKKRIVHCHGVFDLLHIGHIRHFEEAKRLGDVLVVTVTPDRFVNKGPGRPVFNENLRAEAIAALSCVDYVAINRWPMAVETIKLLRPDLYVKGPDYKESEKDRTGGITQEEGAVKSVGGRIVFTEDITFSSSRLINQEMSVYPPDVSTYLAKFSARYMAEDVIGYLENARLLRVLVVGEAIIDEYHYCETIGKSGKEPVLVAKYVDCERFAGGILAVANHVASFCSQPGMVTFLGQAESHEEFIREKVNENVEKLFLYLDGASTLVKRRFVETYPLQKLFELYIAKNGDNIGRESPALCSKLAEVLPRFDIVIVTDYGHGMLGPDAVEILCKQAKFLAVNTQVNAGNRGFNTISKYSRADYICVSESEVRLDARTRDKDLRHLVADLSKKLHCPKIIVTRGQQGCLCYDQGNGFFDIPSLAVRIVDRIGAGDAVLAVTSMCVAQNSPIEVAGFIGNAVGAQAVATMGNRNPIERVPLLRHIQTLLK